MSPRNDPHSLYELATINVMCMINGTCLNIEKTHVNYELPSFQYHIQLVRNYLLNMLPVELFDHLCDRRCCAPFTADSRIQLSLLMHPNNTVFKKSMYDLNIPMNYWIQHLPTLKNLVVLNLRQICTDEILRVVGRHCRSLQLINAISKVELQKSHLNASVLVRKVSDIGMTYLTDLKRLKILVIDPPKNDIVNMTRKSKYISQNGIRNLVDELPSLEELRIESCDVGATLIGGKFTCGTLNLRKVDRHFATVKSVRKLLKLCPLLNDLNLTYLDRYNSDEILQVLIESKLELNKLVLTFFPFTDCMRELLRVKGHNLIDLTLREVGNTMNYEDIVLIGRCCPNLSNLGILMRSSNLIVPKTFRPKEKLFQELKSLHVGSTNSNIENVLLFFLAHNKSLVSLVITYQTKMSFDSTLIKLLQTNALHNLYDLQLDCTLLVSCTVIKQVIDQCEKLTSFIVTCEPQEDDLYVHNYIRDNNLSLFLNANY